MGFRRRPYKDLSDEALMKGVRKRDEQAFSTLYDRYGDRVYNYFYRMLWKDQHLAEDFTQELFMKVIHYGESFDESRSFKTWLFSMANNLCKNEYRKHEVRKNAQPKLAHDAHTHSRVEQHHRIDKDTFESALTEALNQLNEAKKVTFELRYKEELSIKEISQVLNCSEGTIKSRLFYTLKHLNNELRVYDGIWLTIAVIFIPFIAQF